MNRDTLPGTNLHACTSMLADDIADRIAIACPDELDGIIRDMWVDHTHGLLADNEVEALDEAARTRREAFQERRQAARPGPVRRPGNAPWGRARRRQRSPDKQASIERRRRLVASGPLPPPLAARFDPRLRDMAIGVHLIGNDATNTPPAHALGAEGLTANVHGYMIYGDYRNPDPPADLIAAVERGDVDIATAWGPLAGYAAKRSDIALTITPISDMDAFAPLRFQFDIAMGVRKGDHAFKARLDDIIARRQAEIDELLQSYGVPLVKAKVVARP